MESGWSEDEKRLKFGSHIDVTESNRDREKSFRINQEPVTRNGDQDWRGDIAG